MFYVVTLWAVMHKSSSGFVLGEDIHPLIHSFRHPVAADSCVYRDQSNKVENVFFFQLKTSKISLLDRKMSLLT